MNRWNQFSASALLQEGNTDRNNEEGFEALPERDDERLNHVVSARPLNENQSQDHEGSVYFAISDRSSREYQTPLFRTKPCGKLFTCLGFSVRCVRGSQGPSWSP